MRFITLRVNNKGFSFYFIICQYHIILQENKNLILTMMIVNVVLWITTNFIL